MVKCESTICERPAQPEHTPCCNAHLHPLCCQHYNRRHFIEVHQCTPELHAKAVR